MLRKRRPASVVPTAPVWHQRTITLIGDRPEITRICQEWELEGWQVLTVDAGPAAAGGHPTHVVRVAVPPAGWRTAEQLLGDAD